MCGILLGQMNVATQDVFGGMADFRHKIAIATPDSGRPTHGQRRVAERLAPGRDCSGPASPKPDTINTWASPPR